MSDSAADLPTPLGRSTAFLGAMNALSLVAPLSKPVLVVGERGTGKELAAARVHYLSPRWNRPFLQLNCGAISETLLEPELFGHEAGAFTGAQRRRQGRFELADKGTLFLDEIANAPLAVQETILRVVEYGSFERVGGSETVRVDVRLVAATNEDLPGLVRRGRFRADLLDRLAFDVVTLPPLRERADDIELLAEHLALQMTKELKREMFAGFTERALKALRGHPWPGNIRELKNVVERAVYRTAPGLPIDIVSFDPFASPWRPTPAANPDDAAGEIPSGRYDFIEHLRGIEQRLLRDALARNQHHQRRTADYLGLTYDQLRSHLRKHGMTGNADGA